MPRAGSQFFVTGVLLGTACGLIVGSALGLQLSPARLRAARRLFRRLLRRDDHQVRFDLLT